MNTSSGTHIDTIDQLEAIYGAPVEAAIIKEVPRLTPEYRRIIEAAPFLTLATSGPEGLDCSPRGDQPGFVRVVDERTLMIPDRRGNNRIDSLRNVVRDPRIALLFLIPGSGTTLRLNGRARLSIDPELLDSFAVDTKPPRSVMVVAIETVFFQCARAILRASLWDQNAHIDPKLLPSAGDILGGVSGGTFDGRKYDLDWPDRAKRSMW